MLRLLKQVMVLGGGLKRLIIRVFSVSKDSDIGSSSVPSNGMTAEDYSLNH